MLRIEYTDFTRPVFDGKVFAPNERRLRDVLSSQIGRYFSENRSKFGSKNNTDRMRELILLVEKTTGVPCRDNKPPYENVDEILNIKGASSFSDPKISIRKAFVCAVWYYLHLIENKSYAYEIDLAVLGVEFSEILTRSFDQVKAMAAKHEKSLRDLETSETPERERRSEELTVPDPVAEESVLEQRLDEQEQVSSRPETTRRLLPFVLGAGIAAVTLAGLLMLFFPGNQATAINGGTAIIGDGNFVP